MLRDLIVAILLFICAAPILAQESNPVLRYDPSGSSGWYPYYISSSRPKGIAAEAVQAILKTANIDGEFVDLPPKRTRLALQTGDIDFDLISPAWLPNKAAARQFVFSDPIIRIKEHFVYLKTTPPPDTLFSALSEKPPIATVRGYYYHDEAHFQRIDFSSERAIIQALDKGRIKYAICGDLPALFWAKRLNVDIKIGAIHSDDFLAMRLLARHKHLMPRINQAIQSLKKKGFIDALVEKYKY